MVEWPVDLSGVTETVVTTRGPNGLWNVAALGLHSPAEGDPATATTWGNTRTRRNFHREGGGYVQFVADPVDFAEAALSIREAADPVLDSADAWARVEVTHVATNDDAGTRTEQWELRPVESEVRRTAPRTIDRGFAAVVEMTVAVSRLDVDAYDAETLRERLRYFEGVAETCGGERERVAVERVRELADGDW
ncbi:DUF447 domain-containing protein [Halobacterium wangiae]|uniref:DUF447 domain-containing protein n=1 Tax=Halobacterium wangiae TaxID=2902623 RepID=UPI001E53C6EE|nr:DUF447 domain-containing protein [Halobacterium wangiae]